jgi:hypothetical protein
MKLRRRYQVISEAALWLALSQAEERERENNRFEIYIGEKLIGNCREVLFSRKGRGRWRPRPA